MSSTLLSPVLSLTRRAGLSDAFVRFLVAGGFNAGTCVLFASLLSLVVAPTVAFVLGYAGSLTLSYFVNAVFVFRDPRRTPAQFVRFCLSYLPNFAIQYGAVHVMVHALHLPAALAFLIAVAVAVPLTFVLLSAFAFSKRRRVA